MTRISILLFILTAATPALAQQLDCPARPSPVLQIRAPVAPEPIEHTVSAADIERLSGAPPPHALLAMAYALDAQIKIVEGGGANSATPCASNLVIVTFGIGRRDVFLAREATHSACIRKALLAHESEHYRIIRDGAQAFLDRHRAELERALDAAAKWSAPSNAEARANLETTMLRILKSLASEFTASVHGHLREAGDSPAALSQLAHACNDALGEMDRTIRLQGSEL